MSLPLFNHAEAFCLMTYRQRPINPTAVIRPAGTPNPDAPQELRIWNSRDGVTPFCVFRDGHEYEHAFGMKRAMFHQPQLGDLIWTDVSLADARAWALEEAEQERYAKIVATTGSDFTEHYPTFAHWATYRMEEFYGQGNQPKLHVVDEAWLELQAAAQVDAFSSVPSWIRSGRHG